MERRCRSPISRSLYNCSDYASDSNSHDSKSCKVISKLLLPEDLMIHILSLVPLNSLLNSARYVCKSWATTIGSSYFVETCQRHACSKPGLYVENCTNESSSYFLDIKDNVNGSFVFERIDLGTPPKMGRIIANYDGILLLLNKNSMQTFVVNPILKCWLRVPPLPISKVRSDLEKRFTIVRVPHTAEFKLFFTAILEVSGVFWYVFYVLRIGIDNSWKEIARKEARKWYPSIEPLYNGGNYIYWIVTMQGVTMMDIDKEIIVREFPFPPVVMDHRPLATFVWMGNRLSCILRKGVYYGTFEIYILDFALEKWSFYHEMNPYDYLVACGHELDNIFFVVVHLWINDRIIIRAVTREIGKNHTGSKSIHFSYNVKTRQLIEIEGIDAGDIVVWPHTNSLVSLPNTPT